MSIWWFRAKLIITEVGLLLAVAEAALILSLIFITDLRIPAITAINRVKQGKGPLITRTIQTTLFLLFFFSLYSILNIRPRSFPADSLNLSDQLLLAEHSLHASVTGILLFLSLVIEKLHSLIVEGVSLENTTKAEEKLLKDRKRHHTEQLVEHEFMLKRLKATNRKLEFEFQTKVYEAEAVKGRLLVLKTESEGFEAEYDRLLEYNQILKNQLHSIDKRDNQEERGWANLKSNLLAWGSGSSPAKSRDEGVCENEVGATDELDCFSSLGKSSPRHRRPIYQY